MRKYILIIMFSIFIGCQNGYNDLLIFGSKIGNMTLIKLSLSLGAEINHIHYDDIWRLRNQKYGHNAIYYSVTKEHPTCLEYLISKGAFFKNEDELGIDLFKIAINKNNYEMCKILIKHGVDINKQYNKSHGITPLHIAVMKNNYRIVELLLRNGANIDAKTTESFESMKHSVGDPMITASYPQGTTPLQMAQIKKYNKIEKLLLHYKK